jgi:hypothetical protein
MRALRGMKRAWARLGSGGYTLAEALVYIALLTAFVSTMGTAFVQAANSNTRIVEDGLATNELRRGLGAVADDVGQATAATASADSLTLTWTDYYLNNNVAHTLVYTLVGTALYRDLDGAQSIAARGVTDVTFTVAGQAVTTTLSVDPGTGTPRSMSVKALMTASAP